MRYWRQLSRWKIIKEGDRNTKNFHLKANMRRQRNMIDMIWFQGEEVTDIGMIRNIITSYFKTLYRKQKCTRFDITSLGLQKFTQAENWRLRDQLLNRRLNKMLYHAVIHQRHWGMMDSI